MADSTKRSWRRPDAELDFQLYVGLFSVREDDDIVHLVQSDMGKANIRFIDQLVKKSRRVLVEKAQKISDVTVEKALERFQPMAARRERVFREVWRIRYGDG